MLRLPYSVYLHNEQQAGLMTGQRIPSLRFVASHSCGRNGAAMGGQELACGAGGGSPQDQLLRLSEGDVAAVCQGRDAQAATVADVLVAVHDLSVADVDLHHQIKILATTWDSQPHPCLCHTAYGKIPLATTIGLAATSWHINGLPNPSKVPSFPSICQHTTAAHQNGKEK